MIKFSPKSPRSRNIMIITLIVVVVIGACSIGGFVWNKHRTDKEASTNQTPLSLSEESKKNAQNVTTVAASAQSAPSSPATPLIDASNMASAGLATFSAFPSGSTPSQIAQEWYIHGSKVVNSSTISIVLGVKNTGGEAGVPTCTVTAQNDSGTNTGTATLKRPSLAAGEASEFTTTITVSNQGASSVTQISATCL